jgi:hypothetical protein
VKSDGFTVDLGALAAARDRVGRLAVELTGPTRDVPSAEAFGHGRLAEAVTEFATREKRSMASLNGEVESTRHRLVETIKVYRDTDEDVARQFGGIAQ